MLYNNNESKPVLLVLSFLRQLGVLRKVRALFKVKLKAHLLCWWFRNPIKPQFSWATACLVLAAGIAFLAVHDVTPQHLM